MSIGILDSDFGGLAIWREVKRLLPHESLIYFGDSANFPYGIKSQEEVRVLISKIIEFLLKKDVKLVVVACNTGTVSGIDYYRHLFPNLPIVGVVPVVKTAVNATSNGKIGVLATQGTVKSEAFKKLIDTFSEGKEVEFFNIAASDLADIVEGGKLDSPQAEKTLKGYLEDLKKEGVDTICLGCTHFSFLKGRMEEMLGPNYLVLDSSPAIARQVARLLKEKNIESSKKEITYEFYTSGDENKFNQVAEELLNTTKIGAKHVEL